MTACGGAVIAGAYLLTLLTGLRRQDWAKRRAAPVVAVRRVTLRAEPPAARAAGGRP